MIFLEDNGLPELIVHKNTMLADYCSSSLPFHATAKSCANEQGRFQESAWRDIHYLEYRAVAHNVREMKSSWGHHREDTP